MYEKAILGFTIILCLSCYCSQTVVEKLYYFNVSETENGNSFNQVDNSMIEDCDQSGIPALKTFDIHRFSGDWYELGKTVSGHKDLDDGMWRIIVNDDELTKANFVFSGRQGNTYCMKPISGQIKVSQTNPGEVTLKYRTYTTTVSETVRIIYTDYDTMAVIYNCLYVDDHTGGCNPSGVFVSVWTRGQHVDVHVYEKAMEILERTCIDSHSFRVRNVKGPCILGETSAPDEKGLAPDFCFQPMEIGTCSANVKRYFYDVKEKKCQEFEFSGCNGNENNFMSLEECQYRCTDKDSKKEEKTCPLIAPCSMHCPPCCSERNNGCIKCDCNNVIVDKFVDCLNPIKTSPNDVIYQCPSSCTLKELYSGCYTCECQDAVDDGSNTICLEMKQPGHCGEKMQRYYYNGNLNECEKFNYTGCKGNKNNFLSYVDCLNTCKRSKRRILPALIDSANSPGFANKLQMYYLPSFSILVIFVALVNNL